MTIITKLNSNWLVLTTWFTMALLIISFILLITFGLPFIPGWYLITQTFVLLCTPALIALIMVNRKLNVELIALAQDIEVNNRKYLSDDLAEIKYENIDQVKERLTSSLKTISDFIKEILKKNDPAKLPWPSELNAESETPCIAAQLGEVEKQMAKQQHRLNSLREKLEKEKYLFGALMDNIPDYIYFKDRECKLIRLSQHMAQLFNMREEEMIGKSDFDFHDEAHAKEAYDDEQEIMETHLPKIGYVEREVRADGTEIWVSTTKIPLFNSLNEVVGTFGISRDVSNVKRLEMAMKERTESLVKLTERERLAKLEAVERRKEAEIANLAKSAFLATMSHELRTSINGVVGIASLLTKTRLDKEQAEYTKAIVTGAESLRCMIDDILDFSKMEHGKVELELQEVDLRTCVDNVLNMFAAKAAAKNILLYCHADDNVPSTIICDELLLRKVLINLVDNAIKFTGHGEIFISEVVKKVNQKTLELEFRVKDTGIGIPEDKCDHLFKAFFQVDSSSTPKYRSAGLGLAICEKLVALMGGVIRVESISGQGATFIFTIQVETNTIT